MVFVKKKITGGITSFVVFIFLIISKFIHNTTVIIIATALFLSIFMVLYWNKLKVNYFISNACIVALLTAAICSLKSTLIPVCCIMLASSYFFYIISSKWNRKAIYELVIAAILAGIFLLPWMISMYQSSGTLLYPLLGKGYHGSVYGTYLLPYSEMTIYKYFKIIIHVLTKSELPVIIIFAFIIMFNQQKLDDRKATLSIIISSVLGKIIIALAMAGDYFHINRYSFAFIYAAIISSMMV